MPPRIPKVCRARGCTQLTIEQHGYCVAHAGLAIGWRETNRVKGDADARGYGYRWKIIRAQVMRRDNHLCQVCIANGVMTPATAVDHIVNKADGGTDEPSNLQAICDPCHEVKTAAEAITGRNKRANKG